MPQAVPSLRSCGFYVAGFNPVVDYVVMPAGMAVMKAAPGALGRPYTRLLVWSLQRFGHPPFGCVCQAEVSGQDV